ncbi:MAG: BamA/TamA family outer membrane protein [Chlorobi bacterium]|nr:BamA/TamA family outer membrane protein [Chlorobiota bacterium]
MFSLLATLLSQSCGVPKSLQSDKPLLYEVKIEGVSSALKQDLYSLAKPLPNTKFLGVFPLRLTIWTLFKDKKGKFYKWLVRRMGEEPVWLDTTLVARSAWRMKRYLFVQGYLLAQVDKDISLKKRKNLTLASVTYHVNTGPQFVISKFVPPRKGKLFKLFLKHLMGHPAKVKRPFSYALLEEDRQWWTTTLRNEAYVFFNPSLIYYELDTNNREHTVEVYMHVKEDSIALRQYSLRNIYVIPDNASCFVKPGADTIPFVDSSRSIYVITTQPSLMRWQVLVDKIPYKKGLMYDYERLERLMNNGLLSLALFRYANINLERIDSTMVDMYVCLDRSPQRSLIVDLEANTGTATIAGFAASLTYTNRNVFKGSEEMNLVGRASMELQVLGKNQIFRLWSVTTSARLSFPTLMAPFVKTSLLTATTQLQGDLSYEQRPELTFGQAQAAYVYRWREREDYVYKKLPLKEHSFSPMSIYWLKVFAISDLYYETVVNNPRLQKSLQDQLIFGGSYRFLLDQFYKGWSRYWFLTVDLDFAGNSLYLLNKYANISYGDLPISQYFKITVDIRRYIQFFWPPKTNLVIRGIGGVGVPYGLSTVLPYLKQFYAGGAVSMRGWTVRSLGPGSTPYDVSPTGLIFSDRTGDIYMEGNIEYRIGAGNMIEGALFADAGNIWLLRPDSTMPQGHFDLTRFWKEIAIDGGVGLRINLVYFILRVDGAFKIYDPALPESDRIVIHRLFDRNWKQWFYAEYGYAYPFFNFVLALGYPF